MFDEIGSLKSGIYSCQLREWSKKKSTERVEPKVERRDEEVPSSLSEGTPSSQPAKPTPTIPKPEAIEVPDSLVEEPTEKRENTAASSIISQPSNSKKETPSLFRKKEVKQEVVEVNTPIKETEFTQESVNEHWKKFGDDRLEAGAGDAEKLVLSRDLTKKEGNEISILLGSQLEITILEKIEQDLVQYLRKELENDLILLSKSVKEQKEGQKLYTSQDKYDFMVKENPSLKDLKEKLGLDFEY